MSKWLWLALAVLLLGSIAAMFWVTGIGEEAEPLFDPIEVDRAIPTRDPRKLTVWGYGGAEVKQGWDRHIAAFEERVGEKVALELFPSEATYRRVLREAHQQGKLPDLMLVDAATAAQLAQAGVLAPLGFPKEVAQEWGAPTVAALAYPGKAGSVAAYPSDFSLLVLYYNKKMLDAKGMAYPGDHWSWSILSGIAKALFQKGGENAPTVYGIEMPLDLPFWNALAVEFGAPVYADGQWQLADLSAAAPPAKALFFLLDFYYRYAVIAPPEPAHVGGYFLREQSALAVAGANLLPALTQAGFAWGATAIPKEDRHATPLRVEGWGVRADSAKAREAAELALVLASESERPGWLPAKLPEKVEDENLAVFYAQLANAVPPPRLVLPPDAPEAVFATFQAAIEGGDIQPVEVIRELESKLGRRPQPEPPAAATP